MPKVKEIKKIPGILCVSILEKLAKVSNVKYFKKRSRNHSLSLVLRLAYSDTWDIMNFG
jgi:hypothetical protein